MRYSSPLRYPGGKASLSGLLGDVIEVNGLEGCHYYEPYAGGAGAALTLLDRRLVSEIHLNDADPRVHAFWFSVLNHNQRFVERTMSIALTIEEWRKQHEICASPHEYNTFDVGFAAFYMNRCNRSGVLTGAGPIGGYEQTGKWRLDVRFTRTSLVERILALGKARERIHLSCQDAIDFLKSNLPPTRGRRGVFAYLDPPYVGKGQRLYLNSYESHDHRKVARYILSQKSLPWVMSYDDADLIRELYSGISVAQMPIHYSLQEKRAAHELIITPWHVTIPHTQRGKGNRRELQLVEEPGDNDE